jgi:hypothetical protein
MTRLFLSLFTLLGAVATVSGLVLLSMAPPTRQLPTALLLIGLGWIPLSETWERFLDQRSGH